MRGAASTITATVLLAGTLFAWRALADAPSSAPPLSIAIVGHRYWWEITYPADAPSQPVTTANELHIPVGRTVLLQLESQDVIHSLFIPTLNGKRDLVPGHQTTLSIRAERPGAYRAQCAEFCGHQQANVAFWVIAEPPPAFDAWLAAQRQPALAVETMGLAGDERVRRGYDVFMNGPCPMCHTVGGTLAAGVTGPNLTHVATRATLAAGTLPRTPGHLVAWLLGPQSSRPGSAMPPVALSGEELDALLVYLETLK